MQADGQALPSGSHAERSVQSSRRQEYRAANAGGPRAQQASKLEARALFAGSQGGTVAGAGGNTCTPLSVHHGTAALTLSNRFRRELARRSLATKATPICGATNRWGPGENAIRLQRARFIHSTTVI
jgi:hypothetical protein